MAARCALWVRRRSRAGRQDDDKKLPTGGAPRLAHNPFGALGPLRATLPEASPKAALAPKPPGKKGPARAVVRYERKGRGGKEVTLVEQLDLPARELEAWLKGLKGLLEARGVRRVTVG